MSVRAWRTSSIQHHPLVTGASTSKTPAARDKAPEGTWMAKGACVDLPVKQQRWFVSEDNREQKQAVEICRDRCKVRQACDEHANRAGHTAGVWGGLTELQRSRRQRKRERERGRGR